VLDLRTLQRVDLNGCDPHLYRLELAAFLGDDRVLVARGFNVDVYSLTGECLERFQLRATKTPVTAAGGVLPGGVFLAGNGTGCVWVLRFGDRRLVDPARELSAVSDCDAKQESDAVIDVLTSSGGGWGLLVFQSGRVERFDFGGPDGRPRRRPMLKGGARAVAIQRGLVRPAVAVASVGPQGAPRRLDLWAAEPKPIRVRSFSLDAVHQQVDYLGFSADGKLLIGVDAGCALHYWDSETGRHLLERAPGDRQCGRRSTP
jgi:hypothetical protein